MQFLYLFSFAVVASTAAALPQPARPSEKYSNNANTNSASVLEARCYQPVVNPYKDPTDVVSPEQPRDPAGPSEENSGSGSPLRKRIEAGSRKLAVDIDQVGDGLAGLPRYADKIGDVIGLRAGALMIRYLRRALFVNDLLKEWIRSLGHDMLDFIKAGLGDVKYSKVSPALMKELLKIILDIESSLKAGVGAISSIIKKTGDVIQDAEKIGKSFADAFNTYKKYFDILKPQLEKFDAGKATSGYFTNINTSFDGFMTKQQEIHDELMQALREDPSQ
ncbi:hypothetical protein BASA50_008838 [Batrachochytrium salamandrivorans]|uniref:Uncharacterized protein n=1 Tax=Batrachochytrium salamandrivorans TaxID=1357716 RepID=A0ABQ8F332_9FUNG|nr:hypothetical protein BASA50_008838 [Batrachochytrium salamandrivorans]KAH9268714.1 hypothetical protein BASA83_009197 [Batrachochytrium salamandrivorans]